MLSVIWKPRYIISSATCRRAKLEMCGVNGIFAYLGSAASPSLAEVRRTRDHMAARGPDGHGEWSSDHGRLILGHRRLSILDLSLRARQPMVSNDGRFVISYNGEIYNTPELRRHVEAQGQHLKTSSDTEVLLHLFALQGADMLASLRGMFAFAIWDNVERRLFLARDPYGIKPLYISDRAGVFRFASQVKALQAGGALSRDVDMAGLAGFHIWGSVPEPFTLHREIGALPAGHCQWIDEQGPQPPRQYCSVAEILAAGAGSGVPERDRPAVIRQAIASSVAAHLLADVEVGVFLSAGIDSGAVLGLMRDAGQSRVRAITLQFEEFAGTRHDEAPLAADIARLYGAKHIVRTVTEQEFRDDLPSFLDAMDQPSIDGLNTWFVAKAAREAGLKVALSGLGGDELLAGYPGFRQIPRLVSALRLPAAIPGAGRAARALARGLGLGRRRPKMPGLLEYGGSYPGAYLLRRALHLPYELAAIMGEEQAREGLDRLGLLDRLTADMRPDPGSTTGRIACLESTNYMRFQLLRDADWAAMAHGIELRTPLVDATLLAAIAPITPSLGAGTGKDALAMAPSTPLPRSIVDRRKTGFGIPTSRWLSLTSTGPGQQDGHASRQWSSRVLAHALT